MQAESERYEHLSMALDELLPRINSHEKFRAARDILAEMYRLRPPSPRPPKPEIPAPVKSSGAEEPKWKIKRQSYIAFGQTRYLLRYSLCEAPGAALGPVTITEQPAT